MKRRINWGVIFAIFIGLLMVGSTIGFIVGPFGFSGGIAQDSIKVNGHRIDITPNGYETRVGNSVITFTYSPIDVNSTKIPYEAIEKIKNSPFVYLTSEINSTSPEDIALAQYQLQQVLSNQFNIQSAIAFSEPNNQTLFIGCENATQYAPVILFEDANQTQAIYQNNCLRLQAENPSVFITLRDRVVYGMLGILK